MDRAYSRSSGQKVRTNPGQNARPVQGAFTHTHVHSHWNTVDMPIHLTCTSLGWGRKKESPEKNHTDVGRTCKLHRQWPWPGINFLFLTDFIKWHWTKRHYLRTYCISSPAPLSCRWALQKVNGAFLCSFSLAFWQAWAKRGFSPLFLICFSSAWVSFMVYGLKTGRVVVPAVLQLKQWLLSAYCVKTVLTSGIQEKAKQMRIPALRNIHFSRGMG